MKKCLCCGWVGDPEITCPKCGEASFASSDASEAPAPASTPEPKPAKAKKKSEA